MFGMDARSISIAPVEVQWYHFADSRLIVFISKHGAQGRPMKGGETPVYITFGDAKKLKVASSSSTKPRIARTLIQPSVRKSELYSDYII